jgi:hypothetical protein
MEKRRNTIRLTEADLARMVAGALNEKFNKQSMKDAVKAGGGLADDWNRKFDARTMSSKYDLADADADGRIPKEVVRALYSAGVSWNEALENQLLICKDGSAIVVDNPFKFDKEYNDKRNRRQENWLDDTFKKRRDVVRNVYKNDDRRRNRAETRGVKKARGQKPQPEQG